MLFGRSCGDVNEEAEIPGRWGGTSSLPVNSQVSSLFAVRLQILSHGIDQFREVRDEIDRILELVAENLGRLEGGATRGPEAGRRGVSRWGDFMIRWKRGAGGPAVLGYIGSALESAQKVASR